jgi:hypothetical protein
MIKWFANFQIPNSGTQVAWVYAVVEDGKVRYYSGDPIMQQFIREEVVYIPPNVDPYGYLLTLEAFKDYTRA